MKSLRMLNSGTNSLDKILTVGKPATNLKGLGYTYGASHSKTTFAPHKRTATASPKIFQTSVSHIHHNQPQCQHIITSTRSPINIPRWMCHHCRNRSNIRPFYYCLYERNLQRPRFYHQPQNVQALNNYIVWRVKTDYRTNIAYTSLRPSTNEDWYFVSGFSRHMTGVSTYLTNMKPYSNFHVTFGYGVKAKIISKVILITLVFLA